MEDFKNQLAELLEVDNVNDTDVLTDFECWDSLTILSIIAVASENYSVLLNNDDIRNAGTVGGLYKVIISKK